jgi:hypothetical protein
MTTPPAETVGGDGAFTSMLTTAIVLGIFATVAPDWAGPANTLLLIILTLVTRQTRRKLETVHEDVSSAASAALAAAEASAHAAVASSDAARVAKDIGGAARSTALPPQTD